MIASGHLERVRKLGWPCLSHRVFRVGFLGLFSILTAEFLSVLIQIGACEFNLVNIYAPNTVSGRRAYFRNLHDYFLSPGRIVAGDFNCIDNTLDRLHISNDSLPDQSTFRQLMSDCLLIDVWRKQHSRGKSYTWANANYSQASWLDCFLVSTPLEHCVDCHRVSPCSFSDHDFVNLNFSSVDCPGARSGVWKFNWSLLNDANFKRELSQFINDQKQRTGDFQSMGLWWDNLKVTIRDFCQKYCSCKRKSSNCTQSLLTNRLIRDKNYFAHGNESRSLEIRNLECSLSSLAMKEAEGAKSALELNELKKVKNLRVISFATNSKELQKIHLNP